MSTFVREVDFVFAFFFSSEEGEEASSFYGAAKAVLKRQREDKKKVAPAAIVVPPATTIQASLPCNCGAASASFSIPFPAVLGDCKAGFLFWDTGMRHHFSNATFRQLQVVWVDSPQVTVTPPTPSKAAKKDGDRFSFPPIANTAASSSPKRSSPRTKTRGKKGNKKAMKRSNKLELDVSSPKERARY